VPGNFHVGSHAFAQMIREFESQAIYVDYTFVIHHLSFGEKQNFNQIRHHFPSTGINHPLDGYSERPDFTTKIGKNIYKKQRTNIFVEAVPATLFDHNDWSMGMVSTESFILSV
jgi:hypothetical protein